MENRTSIRRTHLVSVIRAPALQGALTQLLLDEYYAAIGVIRRDSPEEVASYLTASNSGVWIAYVGGLPAGCVVLRPLAVFDHAAECKRLYVRPDFRGLGVASALLVAMEECALSSSFEWIYLDSKDDLRDALSLYSRHGYTSCERYNDNPQATIFLRKKLVRPPENS